MYFMCRYIVVSLLDSLEAGYLVTVNEVMQVVTVKVVLTCGVCVGMETSDKLIAVELELEKFGKGVEERTVGHFLVGGTLGGEVIERG